jgi:Ran GTPase-activating protein (RanGAP) involved in mRNA processing and transport
VCSNAQHVLQATKAKESFVLDKQCTGLNLSYNKLGPEGTKYLSRALENNSSLVQLHLEENKIGPEGAQYLSRALENNSSLNQLYLRNNKIGPDGAQHFARALENNSSLLMLDLDNNKIGPKGTQHLARGLKNNSSLTQLHLEENKIGSEGARHVASVIENNSSLTVLNLEDNNIGSEGAQYLAKALENNSSLTQLNLRNNFIDQPLLLRIEQLLSRTKNAPQKSYKDNKQNNKTLAVDEETNIILHGVAEHQVHELKLANEELKRELKNLKSRVPEVYCCPITGEIMTDPVVAADGHTYERHAIENWVIKMNKNTSPMTNEELKSKELTSSHTVKSMIREWIENNQQAI